MRACPRTFRHPSEAICLVGIGEKIVKKLTEKLISYHEERGTTPPPMIPYLKEKPLSTRTNASVTKERTCKPQLTGHNSDNELDEETLASLPPDIREKVLSAMARSGATTSNTRKRKSPARQLSSADPKNTNDIEDEAAPPAKKARQPRAPKQYVPRPRTGGYAVLRALTELDGYVQMTKEELINIAQPYSDSSFTVASDQTGVIKYTAWGTVKTLKDHNLIKQQGRPARFSLTEYGRETGEKMLEVENEMDLGTVGTGAAGTTVTGKSPRKRLNDSTTSYYNFEASTLSSASEVGKMFANRAHGSVVLDIIDLDSGDDNEILNLKSNQLSNIPISLASRPILPLGNLPISNGSLTVTKPQPQAKTTEKTFTTSSTLTRTGLTRVGSGIPELSISNQTSILTSNPEVDIFTPFPAKYLAAGTFTVHLILDNREVAMKKDRDYLQRQLSEINCEPITRPLELGDAMWVAKGKLMNEHGRPTGEEVELALGHVVERKRIDDLVGSIKDGRFHEQKVLTSIINVNSNDDQY